MRRAVELERRVRSLEALGDAVTAMKSLSAHHFREARRAVPPARVYRLGVERMCGEAGAELPAGDGPPGLLVIGGELGLCGSYNADLARAAERRRAALGPGPTLCVGHRAAGLLARRGLTLDRVYAAPTGVGGITALLLRLAEDVLTRYATERLASFDIVSTHFGGVGASRPESVRLLPLGPTESREARSPRYVSAADFASAAARELLYVTLYDRLLDALASEHGARLIATEAAERWLDERTERLRHRLAATRRESSTQEMLEIAAGARARARRG